MRRDQGHKQAEDVDNIEEGRQHEPSSYNNFVVHNLVKKTSHRTLQLEGIKIKYLWYCRETFSKQHFKIIEQSV